MPKITRVRLPTLHAGQVAAYNTIDPKTGRRAKFIAVRCGRRWGKTKFGQTIACDSAIKKESVGWFAPAYKYQSEVYNDIIDILRPVRLSSSKIDGVIRTTTGGRIDFWTLEDESAGRSRHYHKVIIDEAAFTNPNMADIWEKAIQPTLLDYDGDAFVLSNTKGADPENFFWKICNDPKFGFHEYHAPTTDNPLIPIRRPNETDVEWMERRAEVFAALKARYAPLVYAQEILAEFVDWSGVAFFSRDKLLVDDGKGNFKPLEAPERPDVVSAIIDTSVKDGKEHDGTAVLYVSYSKTSQYPLVLLDWDIVQIEGAMLETWLPSVFERGKQLANQYKARLGFLSAFIEDKNSGTILLQQARKRQWPAQAIDSVLTSLGKDARAINASSHVHLGKVKFARHAFDKTVKFKDHDRNHLLSQVLGFRVGDKNANKRADDLLDDFCYAIAINLGDSKGV